MISFGHQFVIRFVITNRHELHLIMWKENVYIYFLNMYLCMNWIQQVVNPFHTHMMNESHHCCCCRSSNYLCRWVVHMVYTCKLACSHSCTHLWILLSHPASLSESHLSNNKICISTERSTSWYDKWWETQLVILCGNILWLGWSWVAMISLVFINSCYNWLWSATKTSTKKQIEVHSLIHIQSFSFSLREMKNEYVTIIGYFLIVTLRTLDTVLFKEKI